MSRPISTVLASARRLTSTSNQIQIPRCFTKTTTQRNFSLSTSLHQKPTVSQIAALRKERPVPISIAREALEKNNNDIHRAIEFLDTSTGHGEKKAEKVGGRSTNEGVVAISLLGGKRVGMVQVGCETDFVARNDVFLNMARSIAGTVAFLDVPNAPTEGPKPGIDPILEFPVSALLSAPLISLPPEEGASTSNSVPTPDVTTVNQTLLASLGQTGENLKLLRAVSFAAPFPSSPLIRYVPGAYTHGGTATEGKVGGVVVLSVESATKDTPIASKIHGPGGDVLEKDLGALARTVARQVVGFPTSVISRGDGSTELSDEEILLEQTGMMFGSEDKVLSILADWGKEHDVKVGIVGMRRWAIGDAIEGSTTTQSPTESGA